MASTKDSISVTNDYIKITVAGYQLKFGKVLETHDNFKEFLKNLDFDEE